MLIVDAQIQSLGERYVFGPPEELPWLKGRDLELVMGEAVCNWLGWPLPAQAKS